MTAGKATLIAAAVAAAFYVVTIKRRSEPEAPLPVSATITHFAPGMAIGSTVEENARVLRRATWVRNAGFTGPLLNDRGFTHARLILSPDERAKPVGDTKARVAGVELVAERSDSIAGVMFDLGIAFRGSPKDGCIMPSADGLPHRRAQYWVTPSDKGGVALLTDWTLGETTAPSQVVVWSILLWSGRFEGSKTLLANFDPRSCLEIAGKMSRPATGLDAAAVAWEEAQVALRDSLHQDEAGAEARKAAGATPLVGGDAADACSMGVQKPTEIHATTLFEMDLPPDFKMTNRAKAEEDAIRSGYARYEWSASDGSTLAVYADSPAYSRGWTGLIGSQCDIESISGPMHLDIANASVYAPDRVVHATLAVPGKLRLVVLGHARSLERQAELLRAARSIRIQPRWGSGSR